MIIDLTGLSFLGCAGIQVLLCARQATQRKQVALRLVCNSPALLPILRIGAVHNSFAVFPTLGDALGRDTT